MCNGGGFDLNTTTIVVGVVVGGLGAIVTSPIWVPAGILYGTAVVANAGVSAAAQGVKVRRTTHVLKKVQKRIMKRVKAGEWQAYMQLLFERTGQEPTMENLHELGVAMLVANDTVKAERYLSFALGAYCADEGSSLARKASVYFARGVVNQELRDYGAAASDFSEALQLLSNSETKTDPLDCKEAAAELVPQLTHAECLNHMGYAKYLQALYKVMHFDDFIHPESADGAPFLVRSKSGEERKAEAQELLEEATRHFDGAIAATEAAPRGMFHFNRGKAKYFNALISSMDSPETDQEETPEAGGIMLTDAELLLMTEALRDFELCVDTPNFGTTAEGHAMRAQALAVLGRTEEGQKAADLADQIDPKVFTIDLSSTVQLMTPWPLPQPPQDDAAHDFGEASFHRPHYCDHCLKLITSFRKAYCCQRCQFRVHQGCVAKAKKLNTCWNEKRSAGLSFMENATQGKEIVAPEEHVHVLQSVYFHKPTWCDACTAMCIKPYGYQCVECRLRVHSDCVERLANCVVRGDESNLRSAGGPGAPTVDEGLKRWISMDMPNPPSANTASISIQARTVDGRVMDISASPRETVASLKKTILEQMGSELPAKRLGLLFGESQLKSAADRLTLGAVGLENGSWVSTVILSEEAAVDYEDISAFDVFELRSRGLFEQPND